jgi:hypothetical protein
MPTLHIVIQAKGGVGKSFVSSLLAQYEISKGNEVIGIDTDPSNATFSSIKGLGARWLNILTNGKIDPIQFDTIIKIAFEENIEPEKSIIIDTGSSAFSPLIEYFIENEIFDMLREKYTVKIHVPLMGGQEFINTLDGLNTIYEKFPKERFIVWLNTHHGEIEKDGITFEKMEIYQKIKKSIDGIVRITKRNEATFGKDLESMTTLKLKFSDIALSEDFSLMSKQRLAIVKNDIFSKLDLIP